MNNKSPREFAIDHTRSNSNYQSASLAKKGKQLKQKIIDPKNIQVNKIVNQVPYQSMQNQRLISVKNGQLIQQIPIVQRSQQNSNLTNVNVPFSNSLNPSLNPFKRVQIQEESNHNEPYFTNNFNFNQKSENQDPQNVLQQSPILTKQISLYTEISQQFREQFLMDKSKYGKIDPMLRLMVESSNQETVFPISRLERLKEKKQAQNADMKLYQSHQGQLLSTERLKQDKKENSNRVDPNNSVYYYQQQQQQQQYQQQQHEYKNENDSPDSRMKHSQQMAALKNGNASRNLLDKELHYNNNTNKTSSKKQQKQQNVITKFNIRQDDLAIKNKQIKLELQTLYEENHTHQPQINANSNRLASARQANQYKNNQSTPTSSQMDLRSRANSKQVKSQHVIDRLYEKSTNSQNKIINDNIKGSYLVLQKSKGNEQKLENSFFSQSFKQTDNKAGKQVSLSKTKSKPVNISKLSDTLLRGSTQFLNPQIKDTYTFSPKISSNIPSTSKRRNNRSHSKQVKSVHVALYEDAMQKHKTSNSISEMNFNNSNSNLIDNSFQSSSSCMVSPRSKNLACEKFKKEFVHYLNIVCPNTNQQELHFLELSRLLYELHFIQRPDIVFDSNATWQIAKKKTNGPLMKSEADLVHEIWVLLKLDNNAILVWNLFDFLLAVMFTSFNAHHQSNPNTQSMQNLHPIQNINTNNNATMQQSNENCFKYCSFEPNTGQIQINETQRLNIHKHFQAILVQRQTSQKLKNIDHASSEANPFEQNLQFQPFISGKSKQLAQQVHSNLAIQMLSKAKEEENTMSSQNNNQLKQHADLLYFKKDQLDLKLQKMRQERDKENEKECSFQPNANSQNEKYNKSQKERKSDATEHTQKLYEQKNHQINKRQDISSIQHEYLKQSEECTFQPDVNKSKISFQLKRNPSNNAVLSDIKAVDKQVMRIKKGRIQKEAAHIQKQIGDTQNKKLADFALRYAIEQEHPNLYNDPSDNEYREGQHSRQEEEDQEEQINQFNNNSYNNNNNEQNMRIQSLYQNPKEPLIFVDVKLAANHSERIQINYGDDISEIANNFAKQYGLDQNTKRQLQFLLQQQANQMLQKVSQAAEFQLKNRV